jgi:hypothetical protein
VSFEDAEGFEAAVAVCLSAGVEVFGGLMDSDLGDGDQVQSGVDLSVPRSAEPVALMVRGPHGQRCCPVVSSECVTAFEPGHSAGLTNEFGCRECSASNELKQQRCKQFDQCT